MTMKWNKRGEIITIGLVMAITGIGNTYNVFESTYAAQKNEAAKEVNANGLGIRGNGMLSHI